jgi:hypothetical protein
MLRALIVVATLAAQLWLALPGHALAAELELTNIPSELARDDRQLWRRAMAEFYGRYDKRQKCWIGKAKGTSWCMRPHTLNRVSAGDATFYYLAVGGHKPGEDNACHACAGALGLFVLSDAKAQMAIVARSEKFMDFGSWGRVPAEENFAVQRLGQPGNFAWVIENGWSGQGVTVTWTDMFGILGGEVKNLGQLPRSFSDEGNCENGINVSTREKCSAVNFEAVYEADKTSEAFASILLKGSGTLKGQPFAGTYRVDFDPATLTYPAPPDLPDAIRP